MTDERPVQAEEQELAQLGQRLKEAREYMGYSQEFVADQLGIPRASVSAVENGKRKVSSLELKQLAKLYRQPVSFLLDEKETVYAAAPDQNVLALHKATKGLSEADKEQVLRFAQFLRHAGQAPQSREEEAEKVAK